MIKRVVVVASVLVVAGSGIAYLMTGNTPQFSLPKIPDISIPASWKNAISSLGESEEENERYTAYKWQDEDGVWHFGQQPPEDKVVEEVTIDSVNTINFTEGFPVEVASPEASEQQGPSSSSPYSPEGVKDLMNDAKNVQQQLDERVTEQQKALENL